MTGTRTTVAGLIFGAMLAGGAPAHGQTACGKPPCPPSPPATPGGGAQMTPPDVHSGGGVPRNGIIQAPAVNQPDVITPPAHSDTMPIIPPPGTSQKQPKLQSK
jgi:hypothetical protein